MRFLSINLSKLDKSAFFEDKKGNKWVNLVELEYRNGTNEFGKDGFIKQDLGKERREAGEDGEIVGSWKHARKKHPSVNDRSRTEDMNNVPAKHDDDDIPF